MANMHRHAQADLLAHVMTLSTRPCRQKRVDTSYAAPRHAQRPTLTLMRVSVVSKRTEALLDFVVSTCLSKEERTA